MYRSPCDGLQLIAGVAGSHLIGSRLSFIFCLFVCFLIRPDAVETDDGQNWCCCFVSNVIATRNYRSISEKEILARPGASLCVVGGCLSFSSSSSSSSFLSFVVVLFIYLLAAFRFDLLG